MRFCEHDERLVVTPTGILRINCCNCGAVAVWDLKHGTPIDPHLPPYLIRT